MLITAPSSGSVVGITTTDLLGTDGYDSTDCTADFGGTSSATPLVAGVVALILEANPKLTWRDVQYVLATTADQNDQNDTDWTTNGAGLHINHKYGFGRVNAIGAVKAALSHVPVAPVYAHQTNLNVNQKIPDNSTDGIWSTIQISDDTITVEHVEVILNIQHPAAGDLSVILQSPSGTQSVLATLHGLLQYAYVNTSFTDVSFVAVPAAFGPVLTTPEVGDVVVSNPADACTSITNCADQAGKIALIDRGTCPFTTKVLAAQDCGAIGVLVANNDAGDPFQMGGSSPLINISSVMISLQAGSLIKQALVNTTVNVTVFNIVYKWPTDGYVNWRFSTVRNWKENSRGTWTLTIADVDAGGEGVWHDWTLVVHGARPPTDGISTTLLLTIIGSVLGGIVIFALFVFAGYKYFHYKKNIIQYNPLH